MDSLIDFALNRGYERLQKLGKRLNDIDKLIDWKVFKPSISELFDNKGEKGTKTRRSKDGDSAHAYDNAAKGRSKADVCMFFF